MKKFIIEGGRPLTGKVRPAGNKNEALPVLMACLLTDEPLTFKRMPKIQDVLTTCGILEKLGVAIPHFVQKFMQNIWWDCLDRDSTTCDIADVERIYDERLLAVQGSMVLASYMERLERSLGRLKSRLAIRR